MPDSAATETQVDSEQEKAVVPPAEPEPAASEPVLTRRSSASAENNAGPAACPEPPARGIEIHLFSKRGAEQVKKLEELSASDGFSVLFSDTDGRGKLLVAIEGDLKRFQRVFKLRLVNRRTPRSARAGYYCQLYVKSYNLPQRYRKLVESLSVPDPQVY